MNLVKVENIKNRYEIDIFTLITKPLLAAYVDFSKLEFPLLATPKIDGDYEAITCCICRL
jgi:hypothetical protein